MSEQIRIREHQDAIGRYEILKRLGKKEFEKSHILKTGEVDESDVVRAKDLFAKGITATNPMVWASYFEHVPLAAKIGKKIGGEKEEFLLWLHELGRLVTPAAYFRNDLIDDRLLFEFGLPEAVRKELPSIRGLMEAGLQLRLSSTQLRGEEPFDKTQEKLAIEYFSSMTPTQRRINIADNLGKRDEDGNLFDLQGFLGYLRSQEARYDQSSPWSLVDSAVRPETYQTKTGESVTTTRRQAGSILQAFIVEKSIEWLREKGVDLEKTLKQLKDYGPKFVIVARHGQLNNPKNIVYNLDSVMKPADIIHINDYGKEQMHSLGDVIKKRKFRVASISYSDQIRAEESALSLNEILKINNIKPDPRLKDVYAPGPYLEGLYLDEWEKALKGNAYDKKRWGNYNHEEPNHVIERMNKTFWLMVKNLSTGEAGILLSHGDSIAWWINSLVEGKIPDPQNLRELIYPEKGQAIIAIIDPQGKFFSHYIL